MKKTIRYAVLGLGLCCINQSFAQILGDLRQSSVSGNFQIDGAYYQKDTVINADPGKELFRYNAFGNVNYTLGNFSAGVRFESYNPPLLGFLPGYKGSGIPYRFARYKHKDIDITVGNFYEQFGSGISLRAYEDRGLLYDNALDGMRVIFTPKRGITLKGLVGKQRTYFSLSPGVVRGFDGEVNITELFDSLSNSKTKVIIGGSFVSKYQEDQDPNLVLPENVGTGAGRFAVIRGGFNFNAEYAYKINDPSYQNKFSYKDGQALIASTSYATNGFSVLLSGKMIDNMSFRSDRNATNTIDMINYLPAMTKPHTYMMMAYYPYASQPNGEVGGMGEIQYKVKKGTLLGGKYGMDITLNASMFYALDTMGLNPAGDSLKHLKYHTDYGNIGENYFKDFNIEINKKFNKKLKMTLMYAYQFLNQSVVQFNTLDKLEHPDVHSHIGVIDITWKYKSTSAIRFETQGFFGKYEYGDHKYEPNGDLNITGNTGSWVTELIEWTPSSKWFVVIADQYNYNNPDKAKRVHYFYGSLGYVTGPTRISVSYGRQRQGIFCAGGVCRFVPAQSGLSFTISSSF